MYPSELLQSGRLRFFLYCCFLVCKCAQNEYAENTFLTSFDELEKKQKIHIYMELANIALHFHVGFFVSNKIRFVVNST